MTNHSELCLLSQQYNPVAICLQETHIKDESRISFKGYTPYNRLDTSRGGGVSESPYKKGGPVSVLGRAR